jgi:acyl-CoA dehydrogenase
MTEPAVASSDATNIQCTIQANEKGYLINGKKWYISGAGDPRCTFTIVMGKTDATKETYRQQSIVIVDLPNRDVRMVRPLGVFGYDDAPHGHMEIEFTNTQVAKENLVWEEGRGFEIAQGRLGGGRLHHCMRLIGIGKRVLDLMIQRGQTRVIFKQKMGNTQLF